MSSLDFSMPFFSTVLMRKLNVRANKEDNNCEHSALSIPSADAHSQQQ